MKRPNEEILRSWLDGELEGEELQNMEAWAEVHAAELDEEFKCEIGWNVLNGDIVDSLPTSVDPPYPEFFNTKLKQAILKEESLKQPVKMSETVVHSGVSSFWQKFRLMIAPAGIAALVAFYAGTQMRADQPSGKIETVTVDNSIYVPVSGVVAEVSSSEDATEIVLKGLAPISDDLDIAAGETSPGASPMMAKVEEEFSPYDIY